MMFRDPKVDPQLQSGTPTEGSDCAYQSARGLIRWGTEGASVPTIQALRNKTGNPTGGTDIIGVRDMCKAYGLDARVTNNLDDVWAALDAGYAVSCAINYRYLNENFPDLSGDRNFMGTSSKPALHNVVAHGRERVLQGGKGPVWIGVHDPLHDKRRLSVPKESIHFRQRELAACMEAMPSGVQACIVKPSWA